jgi:hypothetical protein
MKINVDWVEHIGNLDTYTRWFQNLYENIDSEIEDYISLRKGEILGDVVEKQLSYSYQQNLEISWFGDYDIGVELHRASGDETWFIKFTID